MILVRSFVITTFPSLVTTIVSVPLRPSVVRTVSASVRPAATLRRQAARLSTRSVPLSTIDPSRSPARCLTIALFATPSHYFKNVCDGNGRDESRRLSEDATDKQCFELFGSNAALETDETRSLSIDLEASGRNRPFRGRTFMRDFY